MPGGDRKLTMEELGRPDLAAYGAMPKRAMRVLLDDVRSRHNVGSIFRTADAMGLEGITLCGFTPLPPHREIEKTALGATASVPWEHGADAVAAVRGLQERGYAVWCVEQTAQARAIGDVRPPVDRPLCLVFGNELHGVSQAVVEASDACVMLPQAGTKHSLNVSVCAGIVLWWACGPPLAR